MSFGVSIGDVLKLLEIANRVYKNCRDCTGEYKSMSNEARNLTNLLEDISDKYNGIPDTKRRQFLDAYESCVEVLQELDKVLLHYNSLDTKSKRAWDRLKWDPEKSRVLRERLTSSVVMLNGFYTSMIHDNQVLILEALGRLERDYRGGHREESISSVERIASGVAEDDDEQDEDAAWPQIIRDLEDVGISKQDAIEYRDFIIDWFVRAVNEGRLMEQRIEEHELYALPRDIENTFPNPWVSATQDMQSREMTQSPPTALRREPDTSTSQPGPTASDRQQHSCVSNLSTPPSMPVVSREPVNPKAASPTEPKSYYPLQPTMETPPQQTIAGLPHSDTQITEPVAYKQFSNSAQGDLIWTAQQVVAAWSELDFPTAEKHLQCQLSAVESGEVVTDRSTQPDRRVLQHLIGVCASLTGRYVEAKQSFESAFNGIYLNGVNLDDGDIAAARWLGDVCLHLHEPHNTALAWGVALDGLVARYGVARDLTRRVYEELQILDYWLNPFDYLENSFERGIDPSDIFVSSHAMEKSSLVTSIKSRMKQVDSSPGQLRKVYQQGAEGIRTLHPRRSYRPRLEWKLPESFLVEPLVSVSAWPMQWDPTFLPADAIILHRHLTAAMGRGVAKPLGELPLPTIGLGQSKNLHYITKKDIKWLVETVKTGLAQMGIEYREQGSCIVCRINHRRGHIAFAEGIEIKFRKLQFRNMHGLKVSEVQWATRGIPVEGNAFQSLKVDRRTEGFREVLKDFMDRAEHGSFPSIQTRSKGSASKSSPDAEIAESLFRLRLADNSNRVATPSTQ